MNRTAQKRIKAANPGVSKSELRHIRRAHGQPTSEFIPDPPQTKYEKVMTTAERRELAKAKRGLAKTEASIFAKIFEAVERTIRR